MFIVLFAFICSVFAQSQPGVRDYTRDSLQECEFTTKPPPNWQRNIFMKSVESYYGAEYGRTDIGITFTVEGCDVVTITDGVGVVQGVFDPRLSKAISRPYIKGLLRPGAKLYGLFPPGNVVMHLEAWGGDFTVTDRVPLAVRPDTGAMVYADIPGGVVVEVTTVLDGAGATKRTDTSIGGRLHKLSRTCDTVRVSESTRRIPIIQACNE